MRKYNAEFYKEKPLLVRDEIPIFCSEDFYTQNYEKISVDHLQGIDEKGENPWMSKHLVEELESKTVAAIRKISKSGDKILDAGVGYGGLLGRLPELQRFGVDISMSYLRRIPSELDVCFAKLENLPYKDEVFDIVVSTDVLEHVIDLNKVVDELMRVLKKNGTLILRVPFDEDLSPYLSQSMPYEYVHLRKFTKACLELIFGKIKKMELLFEEKMGFFINQKRSLILMGERLSISDESSLKKFIAIYKTTCKSKAEHALITSISVKKIISDIFKLIYSFDKKLDFIQSHNLNVDNALFVSKNVTDALEIARKTDFELWCKIFPVFFKPTEILVAFKKN
jgi:ubiquinone/menaquinone biosynthesis C-methylase UbiE